MRRALVVSCVLAGVVGLTLGGCGNGNDLETPRRTLEPQQTASSPSPRVTRPDSGVCSLLTSKERTSIAGVKMDVVAPVMEKAKQCRWVKTRLSPLPAIEVETSPANEWVDQLPGLIDRSVVSGRVDKKFSKRLQAAKTKVLRGADRIGKREVCDMFSLIVEANGGRKGSREIVLFMPGANGETTATAQVCSKGVHTLLTYSEPDLTPSGALSNAVLRLVGLAHQRAVKRS
jgi:hypothetical protein